MVPEFPHTQGSHPKVHMSGNGFNPEVFSTAHSERIHESDLLKTRGVHVVCVGRKQMALVDLFVAESTGAIHFARRTPMLKTFVEIPSDSTKDV